MTAKTYDRITMMCMAVAAASALLFEKFPHSRLAIGLLGVLAGVVAVSVYFWNQWKTPDHRLEQTPPQSENAPNKTASEAQTSSTKIAPSENTPSGRPAQSAETIPDAPKVLHLSELHIGRPSAGAFVFYETIVATPIRQPEPLPSVEAVVELVENLFIKRGREYEIIVDLNGRFTVRQRTAREAEREVTGRSGFILRGGSGTGETPDTGRAIAEWAERQGIRLK